MPRPDNAGDVIPEPGQILSLCKENRRRLHFFQRAQDMGQLPVFRGIVEGEDNALLGGIDPCDHIRLCGLPDFFVRIPGRLRRGGGAHLHGAQRAERAEGRARQGFRGGGRSSGVFQKRMLLKIERAEDCPGNQHQQDHGGPNLPHSHGAVPSFPFSPP